MRQEGLRATTFFGGFGCDEVAIALPVVECLAHGLDRDIELSRASFG